TTDLEYNPRLDRARKIFVFSIYTGLAYADAMKLKKKELIQNSDNDFYFEVKRKKTNVETRQYIVDRAYYIIKDFELHTLYKDEVLPKLSNQKLNDALRDLAEKLNIPKKLTSHLARHSFRQLLAEAGVIDMAAIKTLMGHSRSNDIDSIYHHVTDRQLLDARNKLQDYLNLLLN
ncbi:MAG: tyrosine-type recombinase/integrase, partial [Bacteroidia bacterium]|nr:tyrosine-type recombinase/integrase [Bacteroidia bacterium]